MAYFETQYSLDGKKWLSYLDRHTTQEEAAKVADYKRHEELTTRVVRVTKEEVQRFDKVPGKKEPPFIIAGLGVVNFKEDGTRC